MSKYLSIFVVINILLTVGCALVVEDAGSEVVEISLGGGRTLIPVADLPFAFNDQLVIRIASENGLETFADKIYTAPAERYRLSANLERGRLYRASAFYMDGNGGVKGFDTKLFVVGVEDGLLSLRLGHSPKIRLVRPISDFDIVPFKNHLFRYSGSDQPGDSGAKIKFIVNPDHSGTLTSYQYRVNGGTWITQSASAEPTIAFPDLGLYVIQVRYRQESDGAWVVYTFNILRDT